MKPYSFSFQLVSVWTIPITRGFIPALEQVSERPEVDVQVTILKLEMLLELLHTLIELHERLPHALDLLVGQRVQLHPPQRLPLHQLAQQLDERQHKLREAALDLFRIGVDAAGKRFRHVLEVAGDSSEAALPRQQLVDGLMPRVHAVPSPSAAKLYGGHGPVQTIVRSGCAASRRRTCSEKAATSSRGTRYAARSRSDDAPPNRVLARADRASGSWSSAASRCRACSSTSRVRM